MKRTWTLAAAVWSVLALAQGARAEDVPTPTLWLQHTAPGAFIESARAIPVAGGQLDANFASRFRLRWNGYASDQDVYEYVRANLADVKVGDTGKLEAHLFLRAGFDLDGAYHGSSTLSSYYFWRDILDAERDGHVGALRAYNANVTLRDFVPGTALTLGRTYVSHLNTIQLDGGELAVGKDDLNGFAFVGRPVSFFFDTKDEWVYGAGADFKPLPQTRLRAEYFGMHIESVYDDSATARVDQGYTLGPIDGTLSGEYRYIDGPSQLEFTALARAQSGTTLTLRFRSLLDDVGVSRTQAFGFPINPITVSLDAYAKHELYRADLSQAFGKHLLVALGIDAKHAHGSAQLDNNSYRKFRASIDIDGLPADGTHLQLNGEVWDVDAITPGFDNGRIHAGARLSQAILPGLDAWLGTSWQQFKFDDATRQRKEAVRNYYLGAQWAPCSRVSLLLDFDAENSDVFNDLGQSSLTTNYLAQAMVNVVL